MEWTEIKNFKTFIILNVYHTLIEIVPRRVDVCAIKWYESDGADGCTIKLDDGDKFDAKILPEELDKLIQGVGKEG
jgi:hypothetical protein